LSCKEKNTNTNTSKALESFKQDFRKQKTKVKNTRTLKQKEVKNG
jgi:hypothetical protein